MLARFPAVSAMVNRQAPQADHARRSSWPMMARMSAMMFLQYWPLGTWGVTVGTLIAANTGQQGERIFSAGFVGYSTAAGALGSLVSPVLVGFLSDRYFAAQRLLAAMHVGCAVAAWQMYQSQTQTTFFLWLLAYFQCFTPAAALTNKISLKHLADSDAEYPLIRISGTSGWIIAGLFVGFIWPAFSGESIEATRIPLMIGALGSVVMACFSLTLPNTPPEGRAAIIEPGTIGRSTELIRNRSFVMFLLLSVLACIPSMAYNNYGNLFLNNRSYAHPAALMTLGQVSDLLFLSLTPKLIAHFGLRALFASGVAAWAVRYALLAIGSYYGITTPVIAAILLQGPCYVFIYVVGVMYVDHLTAGVHRGAAQGMYALASTGLGHLLGALCVGLGQEAFLTPDRVTPPPYDWTPFWVIPAIVSAITAIVFTISFRAPRNTAKQLTG